MSKLVCQRPSGGPKNDELPGRVSLLRQSHFHSQFGSLDEVHYLWNKISRSRGKVAEMREYTNTVVHVTILLIATAWYSLGI
jgi:hypothetical protein